MGAVSTEGYHVAGITHILAGYMYSAYQEMLDPPYRILQRYYAIDGSDVSISMYECDYNNTLIMHEIRLTLRSIIDHTLPRYSRERPRGEVLQLGILLSCSSLHHCFSEYLHTSYYNYFTLHNFLISAYQDGRRTP